MKRTHLFAIEQHAVDFLDGIVGSLLSLEVDKAVALGVAVGRILKCKQRHVSMLLLTHVYDTLGVWNDSD